MTYKGTSPSPGSEPTGPKPGASKLPPTPAELIVAIKEAALDLIDQGKCETLAEVAAALDVSPTLLYTWQSRDPEWGSQIKHARQIIADRIEKILIHSDSPQALMFLLKGYRPEFRDNFRVELRDDKTAALLEELKALGQAQKAASEPEKVSKDEKNSVPAI